jgi:hypothetical protein
MNPTKMSLRMSTCQLCGQRKADALLFAPGDAKHNAGMLPTDFMPVHERCVAQRPS